MSTLPRTLNIGAIGVALAWTTLSVGTLVTPGPAQAQAQGESRFYTATLAAPAAKRINVAGGVVWSCEGTECTGTKGTSRPVRVCRDLNRQLGDVTAFAARGEALEADMLDRCNA